jgi:wyosine [tRNA(Phe)-imidazoG37] synthetase (radical SAM superfamily)
MSNETKRWIKSKLDFLCTKLEKYVLSNKTLKCKVVFGPVHSRRLGLVLGINNVKPGVCSYNCIYCPVGKTSCCSICTNNCLSPYELYISVKNKIEEIKRTGKEIDYILFAGSGDPALDLNLAQEISILREFRYKIAVFTNSAMMWNENIRENLMFADFISLKVDTVNEDTWIKINRPHQRLRYNLILDGIEKFSKKFDGTLTTETMLIKNINDNKHEIEQIGEFLNTIKRHTSYFMTPIYPTTKSHAVSPDTETLLKLSELIKEKVSKSVMLCCPETEEFFATDDFENELLGLLEIHPINVDAVTTFANANDKIDLLDDLIQKKNIRLLEFNNKKYFTIADSIIL